MIAISVISMFDRFGRVLRVAITGPRRSQSHGANEGYVRIDIPGIRRGCQSGKHVHVFTFPRSIRSNAGRTILFSPSAGSPVAAVPYARGRRL